MKFTFCGDGGRAGEGVLGTDVYVDVVCEVVTATRLLNLEGTNESTAACCCCLNGVAVPIGIVEFNGRYGVTSDVGHEGGDGSV